MRKNIIAITICIGILVSCEKRDSLEDGLIAHYTLNGNVFDKTGINGNGKIFGATATTDFNGKQNLAYSFNGISSYIQIPTKKIAGLNEYSYSVWVKPVGVPTNYSGMILSIGDSLVNTSHTLVYQPASTFFAGSYNCCANPTQSYARSEVINPDQWVHIVVTRDNQIIRMYINSSEVAQQERSFTNGQTASYGENLKRAIIGGRSNLKSDSFFKGVIDDIRIYDRVLTSDEIRRLNYLGV